MTGEEDPPQQYTYVITKFSILACLVSYAIPPCIGQDNPPITASVPLQNAFKDGVAEGTATVTLTGARLKGSVATNALPSESAWHSKDPLTDPASSLLSSWLENRSHDITYIPAYS